MRLQTLNNEITNQISYFATRVKAVQGQNLQDINIVAEQLLVPLFREVFGWQKLRNLNTPGISNFPGIDLADDEARIAIQVTSTFRSEKITHTLEQFIKQPANEAQDVPTAVREKPLYQRYDRLIIYILTEKQASYSDKGWSRLTAGKFDFNKDHDIWDYRTLLGAILQLSVESKERVLQILQSTIRMAQLTPEETEALQRVANEGGPYYTCFLSYAHIDQDFADRLRTDLNAKGVICWKDTHDMRGGQKWEEQIGVAIKKYDKMVLICSRQAVYRPNVIKEILQAVDTERETGKQKLFPIRLDNHILSKEMIEEAREMVKSGEWPSNWVYYVCKYHIPDFSGWKNHDAYQQELQKLLRDLKDPATRE